MCDVPILSLKDGAVWSVSLSYKVQVFVEILFCLARLGGRLSIKSFFSLRRIALCYKSDHPNTES